MVLRRKESYFATITEYYGYSTTKLLKMWMSIKKKICNSSQQLIFLLRCRKFDVLPPHIVNIRFYIRFHSNKVNRKFSNFRKRSQLMILNLEIRDINYNLKYLRTKIRTIEERICSSLPEELTLDFFDCNNYKFNKYNHEIKNKLIKKFNDLLRERNIEYNSFFNIDKSKWLVNVSKKQIPDTVISILSLGDKFSLPINQSEKNDRMCSILETIKNFELNCYKIPKEKIDITRGALADSLEEFLNKKNHVNYIDRYILDGFEKCNRFLRDNSDVFVTKADKGQITVVMDRNDYIK